MSFVSLIRRLPGADGFHNLLVRAEAWWFDTLHHVQTSGAHELDGLTVLGNTKTGFRYLPVRPSVARRVLRELPIEDFSRYTFVDFGSGKGRMLLVAAQYPFHAVQGIEFAMELHGIAVENIRRFRGRRLCGRIEALPMDALDYEFPGDDLVLYFFNPFGGEIMQAVLDRLRESLRRNPRNVFLAMVFPDLAALVERSGFLRLYKASHRCTIYRSFAG